MAGELISMKEYKKQRVVVPFGPEIDKMELLPTRWIVEGMIPHGLTILGGAPKLGKSALAVQLCVNVAEGTDFLGLYPVEKGLSFFVTFEEPMFDVRERVHWVNDGRMPDLMSVTIAEEYKDMGFEWVRGLLDSYPDASVVVLDLVNHLNKKADGSPSHSKDLKFLSPYRELAESRRVSLIAVTHTNQDEKLRDPLSKISGSSGFVGTAKTIFLLEKDNRNGDDAVLFSLGRKTKHSSVTMSMDSETMLWTAKGVEDGGINVNNRIIAFLSKEFMSAPKDIAKAIGVKSCRTQLSRLQKDKVLDKSGDNYFLISASPP